MNKHFVFAARISLSFLWIFTGLTSAIFAREVGYEVLAKGGIVGTLADMCILTGSLLDIALGGWLLLNWRMNYCYLSQIVVILIYTLLLTIIDPSFWLHPFGPVTKNIPVLVMLYWLYRNAATSIAIELPKS